MTRIICQRPEKSTPPSLLYISFPLFLFLWYVVIFTLLFSITLNGPDKLLIPVSLNSFIFPTEHVEIPKKKKISESPCDWKISVKSYPMENVPITSEAKPSDKQWTALRENKQLFKFPVIGPSIWNTSQRICEFCGRVGPMP